MAAESMIRELFRNLETTLHERLVLIEQVLNTVEKPKVPLYDHEFVRRIERLEQFAMQQQQHVPSDVDERIRAIEEHLVSVYAELNVLKNTRTVSIAAPATAHAAAHAAPAHAAFDPLEEEIEVEEEEEPIVEEEEEVEEEQELALEEFEYRGTTYWKDDENNVYGADEDGEVNTDPIGTWNGKRILPLPQ